MSHSHVDHSKRFRRSRSKKAAGAALLITLSLVTLAIIMALAFSGLMRFELLSSKAYTEGLRSEELTRGAALWIQEDLISELESKATSLTIEPPTGASTGNDFRIYLPKRTTHMVPRAWDSGGVTLPARVVRVSQKRSVPDDYDEPGNPNPDDKITRPVSMPSAAPVPMPNVGRFSRTWWNRPGLMQSSELANFPRPDWVFVTRKGPTEFNSFNPAMANSRSDDFVVGRYAYVVYDVGGLLDVNYAGHALSGNNKPSDLDIGRKGSLHFADLREVGLSETQANDLAAWRHKGTLQQGSQARGLVDWIFDAGAKSGYLRPADGDRFFLSRQDLLRFAKNQGWGQAVRFFTVHSLDRNAPSWFPPYDAPDIYQLRNTFTYRTRALSYCQNPTESNANLIVNHHLGAVRRTGGSERGKLLMEQRFSLSDLKLITKNATASPNSDIHKKFGLLRASPNTPWTYTSPDSTSIVNRVKTLAEVAENNRDPDFFEIIQAAVLQGSTHHVQTADIYNLLDRNGYGNNPATTREQQWNLGVKAMKIGTSLIDQADSNSYPTSVLFQVRTSGGATPNFRNQLFSGIENVPYLNEVLIKFVRSQTNNLYFGGWFAFEVWNPHQNAQANLPERPNEFRILASNGLIRWRFGRDYAPYDYFDANQSIGFQLSNVSGRAANPRVLRKNESTTTTSNQLSIPGEAQGLFAGGTIETMRPEDESRDRRLHGPGPTGNPHPILNSVNAVGGGLRFELQYNDGGVWKTFQEFIGAGLADPSVSHADNIMAQASENSSTLTLSGSRVNAGTSFTDADHWVAGRGRIDPRGSNNGFLNAGSQETISGAALVTAPNPERSVRSSGIGVYMRNRGHELVTKERQDSAVPSNIIPSATAGSGYFFSQDAGPQYFASGEMADNIRVRQTPRNFICVPPTGDPPTGDPLTNQLLATVAYNPGGSFVASRSSRVLAFDADGIPRRGDGNRFADVRPDASTAPGTSAQPDVPAKPVMLNKEFRNVGELGYAHRGQLWKTVNFMTGESADAGLLDVFSVASGRVVSGRLNLNSAPVEVLAAVLSGAARSGMDEATVRPLNPINPAQARSIAADIRNIITDQLPVPADRDLLPESGPFWSRGDLVTRLGAMRQDTNDAAYPAIKAEREAVVRALAEVSQVRTWNLLVDVVAEAGKFPPGSNSFEQFQSLGLRRYWVHLAIDRLTGEVLSEKIEVVYE